MYRIKKYIQQYPWISLVASIYIILVFLICHPFGLYFLCDDWSHIPALINGNFFQTKLLRPVANLTLWLDIKFWNVNPIGFHLTNLGLHVCCSILVACLGRTILLKYGFKFSRSPLVPFFCGLLFFSYGFHSEPIFWIVGRGGILSALFTQISLLLFLKDKPFYNLFSALIFILALFTYELSWSLPTLITAFCLYDYFLYKKTDRLKITIAFWALFFFYLAFRFGFLGYKLNYGAQDIVNNDFVKLLRNLSSLFARLFLPPMQSGNFFLVSFILLLVLLGLLCYKVLKNSRDVFVLIILLFACIILSILPAISAGIDTHDTESERLIYPASVFVCILVVFIFELIFQNTKVKFLCLFSVMTIHLFFLYKSSLSYRYASTVSRTIIEALNSVKGTKRVTFYDLPTQYQGAFIFRIGFPKYAPGLLNTIYDSIQIRSYAEVFEKKQLKVYRPAVKSNSENLFIQFIGDKIILFK